MQIWLRRRHASVAKRAVDRLRSLLSVTLRVPGPTGTRPSQRRLGQGVQKLEVRLALSALPLVQTMKKQSDSSVDYTLLSWARREGGDASIELPESAELFLKDSEGRIGVRATASDVKAVSEKLFQFGFEATSSLPGQYLVEGFLTPAALTQISQTEIPGLLGIIPIYRPQTNAGSLINEASYALESQRLNNASPVGYDGSGLIIGVLSDSYNALGGAAADVASGDLPTGVNVLQDISGASDEGRAMMQLAYDIAPGAGLAFATAFTGEAGFAQNIRNLANPAIGNSDVIVDDVFYFAEPFFQDGIVAQAVDDVAAAGVPYFSSAGNSADKSFESSTINFAEEPLFDGIFYDFDIGAAVDTRQAITIPNGAQIRLSFQWDDPFYTVDGVDTDLDIILVDAGTTTIRAIGNADSILTQNPVEILQFTNNTTTTGTTNFELLIERFDGPNPGRIKYINFGTDVVIEYDTNSPTVVGHAAAAGGQAVGAVPFFNHQSPESFTSFGGTTILFSKTGERLAAADVRATPQIAAVDGNINTFFGQLNDFDGDGTQNRHFFGTSAAAPNAAAVAALVLEANPGFSPSQIYSRLAQTAIDVHTPGYDNRTGAGLINAYDAVFPTVTPAELAGSGSAVSFSDGFEAAALSNAWTTNSTGGSRIRIVSNNASTGSRRISLDASSAGFGPLGRNEAILHLDLEGLTDVQLSFANREFGDEDNAMPATFTGSSDSDGVAISIDGVNWFRLLSLTGADSTSVYQTKVFDLSAIALANGLTLSSNTRIKFQQYDNFNGASDGIAIDDIVVTADRPASAGFTIVERDGSTTVFENGNGGTTGVLGKTDTFTVVLSTQPASNVVLSVSSSDPGEATVSASTLVFSPANWDIPQTVTVSGVFDNLEDGDKAVDITIAVDDALSDNTFDAVADQTVSVLVVDSPNRPTVTSISGETTTNTPTIGFNSVSGATGYTVVVLDISTSPAVEVFRNSDIDGSAISYQIPGSAGLVSGKIYRAFLFATIGANNYSQSGGLTAPQFVFTQFSVGDTPTSPPAKPVANSTSGAANQPTIHWPASTNPSADFYSIYLINLNTGTLIQSATGILSNSFTPSNVMADGRYRIWVSATNVVGSSGFGAPYDFNVGAPVSVPSAPTGFAATGDNPPLISWNASEGATSYNVYLINRATSVVISSARGLTQPNLTPSAALPTGPYRIWVSATNVAGTSPFSAPFDFVVGAPLSVPGIPTGLSVTDANTTLPTITWNSVQHASSYAIWFINRDTGTIISAATNITTNAFTPESALSFGVNYRIWVRAYNVLGSSAFSSPLDFRLDEVV